MDRKLEPAAASAAHQPVEYIAAENLADALTKLALPGAQPLGGGTELSDRFESGLLSPGRIVDLGRLPYSRIEIGSDGSIQIGALARLRDALESPLLLPRCPAVVDALLASGPVAILNQATVAGALLQSTRCPWFRDLLAPCNRRQPKSGCTAQTGPHREAAIFGATAECGSVHASDLAVALLALDAVVHTAGPQVGAERSLPISALYRLPGAGGSLSETTLAPGELLLGITVPTTARARRSLFVKAAERGPLSFAQAAVAAAVELDERGFVQSARLTLGGVAPVPWRALAAEQQLLGASLSKERIHIVKRAALAGAQPRRDNRYKVGLAEQLIEQALTALSEREAAHG